MRIKQLIIRVYAIFEVHFVENAQELVGVEEYVAGDKRLGIIASVLEVTREQYFTTRQTFQSMAC